MEWSEPKRTEVANDTERERAKRGGLVYTWSNVAVFGPDKGGKFQQRD